jgi:hypothetical protein
MEQGTDALQAFGRSWDRSGCDHLQFAVALEDQLHECPGQLRLFRVARRKGPKAWAFGC